MVASSPFAGPSRLRRSLARSRAASFARPNRRACSQARLRFNNHRSWINAHLKLSSENKRNDFPYQHFHSSGHLGLKHISIQFIDRAIGERELKDKEGQWIYRLGTLRPQGRNEMMVFMPRTERRV